MKTLLLSFITGFILCFWTNYAHSQSDEKKVISSLNDFYAAYNNIWAKKKPPTALMVELDSLYQIYCTGSLRTELKKLYQDQGLDHDIFTNDYGTDEESMKTLTITKNPTADDSYAVSYSIITEDSTNNKVKVKVIIYLSVKKENGTYRINEVK